MLPRMRLLNQAIDELKTIDPQTAVTRNQLRRLALTGQVRTVMCGRKRLIDLDSVLDYLSRTNTEQHENKGDDGNGQPTDA